MSIMDSNFKKDLRIVKTHKLLSSALLELLKERSFDEIHVKDICEKAMVHRSTFYMHFEDKYHLLTYGLKDMITLITTKEFNSSNSENTDKIILNVFEHVASFSNLYSLLLYKNKNNTPGNILHNQIVQDINNKLSQIDENGTESKVKLTIASQFYAGAILSVISWWLQNGMTIPAEDISKKMQELLLIKSK